MALQTDFLSIDCHEPRKVAEWWAQVLDDYYIPVDPDHVDGEDEDEVGLLPRSRRGPKILFVKVPDTKITKNRIHLDLRPENAERDEEVARLEALGATRVDIGQGEVTWVVMADIEGNEFCVLRRLSDEEKEKYAEWSW
jgi:hypothetical protein